MLPRGLKVALKWPLFYGNSHRFWDKPCSWQTWLTWHRTMPRRSTMCTPLTRRPEFLEGRRHRIFFCNPSDCRQMQGQSRSRGDIFSSQLFDVHSPQGIPGLHELAEAEFEHYQQIEDAEREKKRKLKSEAPECDSEADLFYKKQHIQTRPIL